MAGEMTAKQEFKEQQKALIKRDMESFKNIIPKNDKNRPLWGIDEVMTLKDMVAKDANLPEFGLFLKIAARTGLDPFTKQCHFVKRYDSGLGKEIGTFQTGIDGLRLGAQRTKEYAGQEGPFWCGEDGDWKEIWLDKTNHPMAAKVGVYRKGWEKPVFAIALYKDYVQLKKDGTPNIFWKTRPEHMLGKCAEALALRKTFPQDLSGIYIHEEFGGSSEVSDPGTQDIKVIKSETVKPVEETKPEAKEDKTEVKPEQKPEVPLTEPEKVSFCKRLFTIAGQLNMKDDDLKPYIYKTYGVKSTKDLNKAQFLEMANMLKGFLKALDGDHETGMALIDFQEQLKSLKEEKNDETK